MAEPTRIRVATDPGYDVLVGRDLLGHVTELLGRAPERVALVHPESLRATADTVAHHLAGHRVLRLVLPEGEAAKAAAVATDCWDRLGAAGFTRSDAVVTVGGGATTDVGGFVAATWLRGVPVVHVPTSLLGMVDAAVGGKTGINTGAGKNLVGAFHEPLGVLCDLDLLASLPAAELVAGLAEVVKCGFIADPRILEVVESDPAAATDPGSPQLRDLVERAVGVKAAVVAGDLRETEGGDQRPGREALNYGHTLAHALERSRGYTIRHGEAVAVGMVYVAELARRVGWIDDELVRRHISALESVGLPTSLRGTDFEELLAGMRVDKKSRGSRLRFVALRGLARPAILADPGEAELRAAHDAMVRT